MRPETLKIAVTVKAYRAIGRKHGEAVCVAGVDTEDQRWIRLFPRPVQRHAVRSALPKFDAIEVDARKAADPRPESYQPNVDSITVVDNLPAAPSIGSVRTTGEGPYPRTRFVLS
jgi:hypothetical protein